MAVLFGFLKNARSVFNEQNQLLYYEGFVVDITERKKAEEDRIQFMQNSQNCQPKIFPLNLMT